MGELFNLGLIPYMTAVCLRRGNRGTNGVVTRDHDCNNECVYELGFSELSYFLVYFKREKGMSLVEFRGKEMGTGNRNV